MPEKVLSDINFQPKTEGFSYKQNLAKTRYFKKLSFFVKSIILLIIPVLLFLIFILILNYFNIISLISVSSIFSNLPTSNSIRKDSLKEETSTQETKPYNIQGTNEYLVDGTLEGFNKSSVIIKSENQTLNIYYDFSSKFYYYKTISKLNKGTPTIEKIAVIDFSLNILRPENIGKKVTVQYKIENNKNILELLNLNN